MIESFKDLNFDDTKEEADIDKILQEKLGISLAYMAEALQGALKKRAEEFVAEMVTVAPYGDYGKLMEEPEAILTFLRDEASKQENWKIYFIEVKKEKDQLIEFIFHNKAVDDGDFLKGFVFVGLSGKIRHVFPQVNG